LSFIATPFKSLWRFSSLIPVYVAKIKLQTERKKEAVVSEERIDKRCYRRAAQQNEQAQDQQYDKYGNQPPLFIVFEESPKFRDYRASFLFSEFAEFFRLIFSRIFRHLYFLF